MFTNDFHDVIFDILQDKYLQKVHFSQNGIPIPEFRQVCTVYFGYNSTRKRIFRIVIEVMKLYCTDR